MRTVLALAIAATVLCSAPWQARADELNADQNADLGPAAPTGQMADDGFDLRARTLHESMGCGNEFEFMQQYISTSRFGVADNDPTTPEDESQRNWPQDLMVGKAALLLDPAFRSVPPGTEGGDPRCTSSLGLAFGGPGVFGVASSWAPLTEDGVQHPNENAADVVNRVYREWFDTADGSQSSACDHVASMPSLPILEKVIAAPAANPPVTITLTPACLARQIRVVMTDPGNGPWKSKYIDGHYEVVPELAGTDGGLPCLSQLTIGVDGLSGDWDQAVLGYTRLTHLLYRVGTTQTSMDRDIAAALGVLNTRFLTLRSSPGDATARDEFNLATSCGNTANKFGSASDTMTGSGSDPGVGRYSADGKDAVGHSSFWKSLLRFLAILALVVAAVVAAAVVGAVAGVLLGAGAVGAAAAAAAGVVVVVVLGTLFFASIPETENHLLMQNSARYLKNKLMMAELSQQGQRELFDKLSDLNEEVRTWLLNDLQRIAQEDFNEYNAKPYGRLSHFSLLNLIDYACDVRWDYALSAQMRQADAPCDAKDRAIVDAAAAVFDLSAAKTAVGSLDGRKMVPFRRRAEANKIFYDSSSTTPATAKSITDAGGADTDTMDAALQVWTGQMRFVPWGRETPADTFGRATNGTFGNLVFYSTSHYRPDATIILDIAVDKTTPRWQQYRHHTREAYSSGDGWLITAGGTDEGTAQGIDYPGFTLHLPFGTGSDVRNSQRGVGVPTTLMTDAAADPTDIFRYSRVPEFLRFDGKIVNWDGKYQSYSNNNCVAKNFACGLNPHTPMGFEQQPTCATTISDKFVAIDSTQCPAIGSPTDPARGIYIAFYNHDGQWGFFEVAPHAQFKTEQDFIAKVRERNSGHLNDWGAKKAGDKVSYVTVDGSQLEFTPEDEDFSADQRACGIVNHESGSRFTISSVPAAQSGNCLSVGRRIFIDLNDAKNPVRKAENGAPLRALY